MTFMYLFSDTNWGDSHFIDCFRNIYQIETFKKVFFKCKDSEDRTMRDHEKSIHKIHALLNYTKDLEFCH